MTKDQNRSRHVLFIPSWYSYHYHRGVASYAKSAGWSLDASMAHDVSVFTSCNPTRLARDYDGIIGVFSTEQATIEFAKSTGLPAVDLAANDVTGGLPRVLADNHAVGRMVAKEFLSRGFEHLAFFQMQSSWASVERYEGFSQTLVEAGVKPIVLDWQAHAGPNTGRKREMASRWLTKCIADLPHPLGLMATNDDVGVLALDACLNAGLLVPEQVAIIGCDNDELVCQYARVPLSSVDTNLEDQARCAAELLDSLMRGEVPPNSSLRVEPRAVAIRRSSDILAMENVSVARALRYIWSNYTDAHLSVPEIAEASGLTIRGLAKSFKKEVGRNVSDEVLRLRLRDAKPLLKQPEILLKTIAFECGFSSGKHFCQAFKRETGITPKAFRSEF